MFNPFQKKQPAPSHEGDASLNLSASSSDELRRVTISPSAGLPQDSAVIPNIEAWLKGRSSTQDREILRNPFDDTAFQQ
ncbi:MAG: hypothetical protein ACK5Q5_15785 [Planctomycetaceae bacterium]